MSDDVFHISDAALRELFGSWYDLEGAKNEEDSNDRESPETPKRPSVKIWHCFENKQELNNSEREFVRKVQQAIHVGDQSTRSHFGPYRTDEFAAVVRDSNAEYVFLWSDGAEAFPSAEPYSIQIDGDVQCLVLQPLKMIMSGKDEKLKLWNLLKAVSFSD